ncbi:MAG: Aspartate aminotransferase [Myxococcaceae bacterium]|nr:Aspartate aminotransferase [Myxococcaceae bacterium]
MSDVRARISRVSSVAAGIRQGVFSELQRHIDAFAATVGDLVPLQIGDTCVAPPIAEGTSRVISELGSYGATVGLDELRRALATSLLARGFGPAAIDPKTEVMLGVGATHALACAARTVLEPGDEVLLLAPYWPLAHGILRSCGAVVVEVPFTSVLYDDPSADVAALLAPHLTPRTRAIYLITPNNPDGKVLAQKHLEAIARVAVDADLWVFADEVYADYTYEGTHISIAALPGMAARTLTAFSFSKSHALAGARVGALVAAADVIEAARRVSTHTVFNVPVTMQRAALEALTQGDAWVTSARRTYREARDRTAEALAPLPLRFAMPDGGVYFFVDFTQALAGRPLHELMAHAIAAGVLLAPGEAFGQAYATSARLCFTSVPLPRVLEGISRLKSALTKL